MNPFDLVGIPCVNPPLEELLQHVISQHSRDLNSFFTNQTGYKATFTFPKVYRTEDNSERAYAELQFFWKRDNGTTGNNLYYFNPSVFNILKPMVESKGKLESIIVRRKLV